jgi:integrase
MPVYQCKDRQGRQRWRFTFNRIIEGERTRATKLLPAAWSRAQAEKYDREETGRLYAVASGLERPEPTIGKAVGLYLDHRVPKLRAGRKITQDLAFLAEYIEARPISQVGDVSREYIKENPALSVGTLHNRLAYLKAACRYAWKKHKLTDYDPTGHMEIPQPNNARDVRLPVGKLERFLKRIEDAPTRAIFTLAFYTGSRWFSEIHPRTPADVERAGRDVWLRVGLTKNGTPRMVWVHPSARWALAYLPFKYAERYYRSRFNAIRATLGADDLVPHDMRHVVASDILNRGGTLSDVGEALHHKSVQASARYAHMYRGRTRAVLAGIGGRKMHNAQSGRNRKKAA